MSAPRLVCLKGGKITLLLEQKSSPSSEFSLILQENLPAHLLWLPCALMSPFGSIKVLIHHFAEETLRKLFAGIQTQRESASYFWEKINLWRDPVLCFLPRISTHSWQNALMAMLRPRMWWEVLPEGSVVPSVARAGCRRAPSYPHQHTLAAQTDKREKPRALETFINKNFSLQ